MADLLASILIRWGPRVSAAGNSPSALVEQTVAEIESFLRGYQVEPEPRELPELKLRDRNDVPVIGSAINAGAEILITGDQEMLRLNAKAAGLQIVTSGSSQQAKGRAVFESCGRRAPRAA
jgi:hypothetical protein